MLIIIILLHTIKIVTSVWSMICSCPELEWPRGGQPRVLQGVQPGKLADLLHSVPHCGPQPGFPPLWPQGSLLRHLLHQKLQAFQEVLCVINLASSSGCFNFLNFTFCLQAASLGSLHGVPLYFLRLGRWLGQALVQDPVVSTVKAPSHSGHLC